ncbi:hypothetical protein [Wolbachia endosymbiont (group A) of Sympetrum striolatum]|uniref:hypothetical protein n=1 Tax=Wolbachia endosymbiont (group A) of Sympetrum striolatum TaxID=2954061 RepID=UPI002225F824|nr:hypothetical protein [Wolbachia endosymbiont (group A) of Sympetrum striolatum]
MNPRLKTFLVVCGYVLLIGAAIGTLFYHDSLLKIFINALYAFLLAKTSSEVLAAFGTLAISLAACVACYGIHKLCSIFTEKITSNYQSFKNKNSDDSIFSEVYNDPTIGLKDKILFFSIYLIYYIQLPFLYCASKISALNGWLLLSTRREIPSNHIFLVLINAVLLIPVALLELIKYPLVRLFSPLGLNVKQLSFLFNVSDVGTGSQSVHTSSFEHSIFQCAQELKQKFGAQPNVLNKEFEDYINNSDELTTEQKEQLKLYLNFNGSNGAAYRESKTSLTLTQAANLVLTAAKDQKSDIDFLKCMLLIRFKEGNGKCNLGMFNRIIYSLSCLEDKNNFTVEVNAQVYERMPSITEKFLRSCNNKKITVLKDNFDNFYSDGDMDPQIKSNISKLIEEAKQSVFNELYVDYYNRYGQDVGRGPIKHKLKELITSDDVKEAISAVIDGIEIPPVPPTYLERVKAFFGGHARSSAA